MTAARGVCIAGDAREAEGYRRALEGRLADVLLTDPPYCLLTRRRKGGDLRDPKGRKIERDPAVRFESVRDYRMFTEAWLPRAVEQLKPAAPLILWTNFLGKEPIVSAARKLGYEHLAGEFVWAKKTTERDGNEQLLRVYEVALVLGRTPWPAARSEDAPVPWSVVAGYDDEKEGDAWGAHPHHKPFGVIEPLVRTYCPVGGWVLDPFAGSGSIGSACVRLFRNAACLELKPDWARTVQERFEKAEAP